MTQNNEIANVTPNEVQPLAHVVQDKDGKFKKVVEYEEMSTVVAETKVEKLALFDVLNNEDSEKVAPMKDSVGTQIAIVNAITQPYQSVDEDTGEITNGVVTYLQDKESGIFFVTSSKSVYWSLLAIVKAFGTPSADEPAIVEITSKKQKNGNQINIKLVG